MNVEKIGAQVPISAEMAALDDEERRTRREWQQLDREQLAQAFADVRAARAQERDATPVAPLTLERLLERLGWTPEFAAHYVQPYCGCVLEEYGWDRCEHARDLGLDAP